MKNNMSKNEMKFLRELDRAQVHLWNAMDMIQDDPGKWLEVYLIDNRLTLAKARIEKEIILGK